MDGSIDREAWEHNTSLPYHGRSRDTCGPASRNKEHSPRRGRNITAQGNALGHRWSQWRRSPERAKQQAQWRAQRSWKSIPRPASESPPCTPTGRRAHRRADSVRDVSCCSLDARHSSQEIAAWLAHKLFRPFRADAMWVVPLHPGRCPGLTCGGPFGAKDQTIVSAHHNP